MVGLFVALWMPLKRRGSHNPPVFERRLQDLAWYDFVYAYDVRVPATSLFVFDKLKFRKLPKPPQPALDLSQGSSPCRILIYSSTRIGLNAPLF
jgi:hypothetical protein